MVSTSTRRGRRVGGGPGKSYRTDQLQSRSRNCHFRTSNRRHGSPHCHLRCTTGTCSSWKGQQALDCRHRRLLCTGRWWEKRGTLGQFPRPDRSPFPGLSRTAGRHRHRSLSSAHRRLEHRKWDRRGNPQQCRTGWFRSENQCNTPGLFHTWSIQC